MTAPPGSSDVAHVIQLAVAPVFLLSGVGVMLNVLTSRLARIVDRARVFEGRLADASADEKKDLHDKLATLSRRATLVGRAVALSTTCALLVCVVVVTLFVGAFTCFELSRVVALLFVAAMLALIGALVFFLREIFLATATVRIGPS
jgi:hypothetical protein